MTGRAGPPEAAAVPLRQDGSPGPRPAAGFLEARIARPVLSRVEDPKRGDFELRLLGRGLRVELVNPDLDGELEVRALLADGRTAWVPPADLEVLAEASTLPARELLGAEEESNVEPYRDLPAGLTYRRLVRHGARLHLVSVDLRVDPTLEFLPVTTARYDARREGEERVTGIDDLARRARALVALNGPFFIPVGKHRGKPLGSLVAGGELLFDLTDEYVLACNRTYLAWTSAGRFVLGETEVSGSKMLALNRQDAWDRTQLGAGERIVGMVGGLGRLAEGGDPEAWREHAGRQFAASYYGRVSRRPQAVLGLAEGGRRLLMLVQEGFPHSRRCYTLPELSQLLVGLGATEAAFTDGGGSADLVLAGRQVVRTEYAAPRRRNSTALVLRRRAPRRLADGTISVYSSS